MEVADRARRHRFLCTLPYGGRLESLRWVLEGPKELLPPQALLQRQELLSRYPSYQDLLDQAARLRRDLAAMPLVQDDAEKTKKQGQAMTQLMTIGRKQEIVLREMAVRRDPAAIAFPPLKTTAEIQKSLPPGHALLVFFATSRNLYAFLLSHEKYATWQVASTPQALARQVGHVAPRIRQHLAELRAHVEGPGRRQVAANRPELLDGLLKGSRADFATKFDELIIVPDGLLWYVPFEALQVQADGQLRPLISRFRIRYAPTAGLATATLDLGRRQRQYGDPRWQTQSQVGRRSGREHGQGPVEIAARLRDAEDAAAGLGPDLCQFHRPSRGARRTRARLPRPIPTAGRRFPPSAPGSAGR